MNGTNLFYVCFDGLGTRTCFNTYQFLNGLDQYFVEHGISRILCTTKEHRKRVFFCAYNCYRRYLLFSIMLYFLVQTYSCKAVTLNAQARILIRLSNQNENKQFVANEIGIFMTHLGTL